MLFILTNSRALSSEKVSALVVDICCNLQTAAKLGSTCIVTSERDITVFAAGMILLKGKRFLRRTAASFVLAMVGITSRPPILPKDLGIYKEKTGGLIVVGSYVPKTTKQIEELKAQYGQALRWIEEDVLYARVHTTGVVEIQFSPVGENKEGVTAVIFCAFLCCYKPRNGLQRCISKCICLQNMGLRLLKSSRSQTIPS